MTDVLTSIRRVMYYRIKMPGRKHGIMTGIPNQATDHGTWTLKLPVLQLLFFFSSKLCSLPLHFQVTLWNPYVTRSPFGAVGWKTQRGHISGPKPLNLYLHCTCCYLHCIQEFQRSFHLIKNKFSLKTKRSDGLQSLSDTHPLKGVTVNLRLKGITGFNWQR